MSAMTHAYSVAEHELKREMGMNTVKHLAGLVAFVFLISCGGGGGGSSSTSESANDKIIGNFYFLYTVGSQYDDRVTITSTTSSSTSDATPIYTGYNADYTSYSAVGAWYPSLGKYIVVLETALTGTHWVFYFVIEGDNRLTGTWNMMIDNAIYGSGYDLDSSQSKKFASGAWAKTMSQKTGGENISLKIQEAGVGKSLLQEDVELKAKIAELKSALDSLGK
jgi:hypothetical protein